MKIKLHPDYAPIKVRAMTEEEQEEFPKWGGFYMHSALEIAILPAQEPKAQAELLIHEIIHAVWAHAKLPPRLAEETVATKLGWGLGAVLMLNPQVMSALAGALYHDVPIVT